MLVGGRPDRADHCGRGRPRSQHRQDGRVPANFPASLRLLRQVPLWERIWRRTLNRFLTPMKTEAANAGFYSHKLNGLQFPKLQWLTIKELLDGKILQRPVARHIDEANVRSPLLDARGLK